MQTKLVQADIMGHTIEYPVRVAGSVVTVTSKGQETTEIISAYDTLLREENWKQGLRLMRQERHRSFVDAVGARFDVHSAPIRVSDDVEPGFYYLDPEGLIVINEQWALVRAIDSDGDVARLITTESKLGAILIKFPLTKSVPVMYRQMRVPVDHWYDYDGTARMPVIEAIRKKFMSLTS